MNSGTFVANDGTCWQGITSGSCTHGTIAGHNVSKEKSGPTSYAKRNNESCAISSWRLLINEPLLRHIKNCREEGAHQQLGKK
ncbi:hypothetical protein TNCV_5106991 [Trichonephila clavipes]|uniref:Uncharacterized protein n=1 Tax=Trichonephila clavipes TaxID=2585209 RepID=A0A8X6REH4_TRICX|nr:hypothetical protein TNCV_5106991 [Trichonephila clavipes]